MDVIEPKEQVHFGELMGLHFEVEIKVFVEMALNKFVEMFLVPIDLVIEVDEVGKRRSGVERLRAGFVEIDGK